MVGEGKVSVPEARVKALRDFKLPKTKKDMHSYLGTVGYYSRFIRKYAEKAWCLTKSTTKSSPKIINGQIKCM